MDQEKEKIRMDEKAVDDKEKLPVPGVTTEDGLLFISVSLDGISQSLTALAESKALWAIADNLASAVEAIRCLGLSNLSGIVDARLRDLSGGMEYLSERVIAATDLFGETAAAQRRERGESES